MVERVLRTVEAIPPGRLANYGLLGELLGIGPRQVGAVLARHGSGVPWWRVTNASGSLPDDLLPAAREHWAQEGIALRSDGRRADLDAHLIDMSRLGDDPLAATTDLQEF